MRVPRTALGEQAVTTFKNLDQPGPNGHTFVVVGGILAANYELLP